MPWPCVTARTRRNRCGVRGVGHTEDEAPDRDIDQALPCWVAGGVNDGALSEVVGEASSADVTVGGAWVMKLDQLTDIACGAESDKLGDDALGEHGDVTKTICGGVANLSEVAVVIIGEV